MREYLSFDEIDRLLCKIENDPQVIEDFLSVSLGLTTEEIDEYWSRKPNAQTR